MVKRQNMDRFSLKVMFESHYKMCLQCIQKPRFPIMVPIESSLKCALEEGELSGPVWERTFLHENDTLEISSVEKEIAGIFGWIIENQKPGTMEKLLMTIIPIFIDLIKELGETVSIYKCANELGLSRKTIQNLNRNRMLRGFLKDKRLVIFKRDMEVIKKIQREIPEEFDRYIERLDGVDSRYSGSHNKKRKQKKFSPGKTSERSCESSGGNAKLCNNKIPENLKNSKVINLQKWQQSSRGAYTTVKEE